LLMVVGGGKARGAAAQLASSGDGAPCAMLLPTVDATVIDAAPAIRLLRSKTLGFSLICLLSKLNLIIQVQIKALLETLLRRRSASFEFARSSRIKPACAPICSPVACQTASNPVAPFPTMRCYIT
jgi:hypothetical protein